MVGGVHGFENGDGGEERRRVGSSDRGLTKVRKKCGEEDVILEAETKSKVSVYAQQGPQQRRPGKWRKVQSERSRWVAVPVRACARLVFGCGTALAALAADLP